MLSCCVPQGNSSRLNIENFLSTLFIKSELGSWDTIENHSSVAKALKLSLDGISKNVCSTLCTAEKNLLLVVHITMYTLNL